MKSPTPTLRSLVEAARHRLRRDTVVAIVLAGLSVVPLALLAVWFAGLVRPWQPGPGPLVLDALVVAGVAALVLIGIRRWLVALDERAIAADAERTAGVPEGTISGVLELGRLLPEGTSPGLARRAERAVSGLFSGSTGPVAAGLDRTARRRRTAATTAFCSLTLAVALLGFASPDHARSAWSPLATPVRSMAGPVLPALVVMPGDAQVVRGSPLAVRVRAVGRDVVTVHWRTEGDVPREEIVTVIGDSAVLTLPAIGAPTSYHVRAPDGARSPTYAVAPVDALLLSELSVDVVYPPHVDRPADHFEGELPPLEVPEGTQIVVDGRATRPLSAASLSGVDSRVTFDVEGDRFSGSFIPRSSGHYTLDAQAGAGEGRSARAAVFQIVVTRDMAPTVTLTTPARDTTLDASLMQAVAAQAEDDHGIRTAEIVSWRTSRTGVRDPEVVTTVDVARGSRTMVRALLDATERDMSAGDTLRFFIRVTDNAPDARTGRSATVALGLPTLAELRERSTERAGDLLERAAELASEAGELESTTRELERRTRAANARRQAGSQPDGGGSAGTSQRMDFQEASAARQVLERQEDMLGDVDAMRRNLEALRDAMEQSGVVDAELQRQLQELRSLYGDMETAEAREQLEAMRQAVEDLDPEAVEEALAQMAARQEELKDQLERSRELMERAATAQEMGSLAQDARELAAQQEALAQAMGQAPSQSQAERQEQLAEQADRLADAVEGMQDRLEQQGEDAAAQQTASAQQSAAKAGSRMTQAASDAARQDGAQAAQNGAQAAGDLQEAAETLEDARQQMTEAWRQQAQESMQQATSDALSLAEQQQDLLDRMQQQSGQEQSGQQQGDQQQGDQQQGGQQQGGQQQGGQQQGGQQQGGQQQGGQQQGGQQQGGQQQGGQQGGGSGAGSQMQGDQAAVQQGLEQLGRNLQQSSERSGTVTRETSSALSRAGLSMQQTLNAMRQGENAVEQAQQTLDALNRLALSLVNNSQQMQRSESGSAQQQAMQEIADAAMQQASLNGQSSALSELDVPPGATSQQMQQLADAQMEVARRLGAMNQGGQEDLLGDINALASEAEDVARQMRSGTLPPETLARQERLFHRLLDAGRSLEKEEYEDERSGERAGAFDPRTVDALDPRLFEDATRFPAPTAEQLRSMPPAYRQLILDYFERLNRPLPPVRPPES